MASIHMKQGDVLPVVYARLRDTSGPLNLSTATVAFKMGTAFTGACEVLEATAGRVVYRWSASDTVSAGKFQGTFIVTYQNGSTLTVPTVGYVDVTIEAQ